MLAALFDNLGKRLLRAAVQCMDLMLALPRPPVWSCKKRFGERNAPAGGCACGDREPAVLPGGI